ncbi:MAG: hypothetical protein M1821_002518 [Bathelium mastoideum]|nr:MAG: hypothetical protein M1821_002518 [Bathelium mastoideum]
MAVLLFYRRLFGTSKMWYIVFGFALAHGLENIIAWLPACRPVSYYWRQYTDPTATGSCINVPVFYLINGIIGLTVDISILLTPIPTIWKLRMDTRQKVAVYGILLLGSFVCVTSIVRIVVMDRLVKSTDFTWAMCQLFIWSCVEPSIGTVCACLPTYAPLLRRWSAALKRKGGRHSGATPPYYMSGSRQAGRREWNKIKHRGPTDLALEADDEVELAPDAGDNAARITEGGPIYTYHVGVGSSEGPETTQTGNDIVVMKDFSWNRSI